MMMSSTNNGNQKKKKHRNAIVVGSPITQLDNANNNKCDWPLLYIIDISMCVGLSAITSNIMPSQNTIKQKQKQNKE